MDERALDALEFPALVARLANVTATPYGEELAQALVPSADADEVARRQALTAEAISLIDVSAEPPLEGIHDVRSAAEHTARGGVLAPEALRRIAATITGGLRARAALDESADQAPLLHEIAGAIDRELAPLAKEIDRCIEDDGSDLRDGASPLLRRLRKELRGLRHTVVEELRRLARAPGVREYLQEDFVTQRGGRPVLALKASARRNVQGIVHDSSGSGQTLFVEPFEIVELSNRQSEAAGAEREEAERILGDLSASAGAKAQALTALVEAAGELDLALARGTLSRRWRGAPVEPSDEVRLLGARHPLLDPATAVPIDLDLGDLRALVISGPNTGGKTVALKTLGVAALLHQSGLRPPAARAVLPVFDRLLADIGDQQSIAMSLSTFSAHIANVVAILRTATARSLVLVDELASGTDPAEGAALSQAVLTQLARQARLTVVTTHYPELKEWASATEGAANAGTGIDAETHEPLYRIVLGRPGTSYALQTAERLGLDEPVVADARARVAPERLRIAELLAEAAAAERAAVESREAAGQEREHVRWLGEQAQRRADALETRLQEVRASAAQAREQAIAQAERDLADARAELEGLREEIRVARRRQRESVHHASTAAVRAESERDRRLGAASTRAARTEDALRALHEPLPPTGPLAVGDPVAAPALGLRGTIGSIDGDEAEVIGGSGQRVRIALARLQPDTQSDRPRDAPEPAVKVLASARGDVSDELDVRGTRAQEAREAVRSFVDDAALAGLGQVRVVHGRGTGAVRAAVREELDRHPLVERRENDSADGATVVYLAP
ncbi:MAG: endonuclease MutS2 [Gaiellaceae bacterium]